VTVQYEFSQLKIVSVLRRLDGEVAFTNFVIQKLDWQTKQNKQKNKHPTFSPPGSARCPNQTKLGTVIEEVRTFLAPPKHVRFRRMVLPLGGAVNLV